MTQLIKIPINQQTSCSDCPSRKFAWFEPGSELDMAQKENLRTGQHRVRAGEYIFMEGERHTTAFTLKEGWAICYKVLSNGQRQIVHIAIAGDFLGYKTNYSKPIDYSVKAITDCVVCSFSEESIKELLASDPKLIMRLLEIQEKHNTACRLRLSYMGQAQAKQKIAYFLSSLIERLERRGFDMSKKVSFPLTREEIADAIGVTTVHLSRVSVELHTSNIVDCKHGYLKVLDFGELKVLANAIT